MLSRVQITLVLLCLFVGASFGQDSLFLAKIDRIQSEVLQEERILNVYLPQGYQPDSARNYPVIYVLDGSADEDFIHVAGVVQFLEMTGALKTSILVGIANRDRKRDFTFPTTVAADKEAFPTTGGSEKFIQFLEKEVIPFVQKYYKASSERTIIGQSLGGLLACEILAKHANLFSRYLIVSPSLWWDNESLLNYCKQASLHLNNEKSVFIAVGKEHPTMVKEARTLAKILARKLNDQATFVYLKNLNHANILHEAVYQGLEWLNKQP